MSHKAVSGEHLAMAAHLLLVGLTGMCSPLQSGDARM